MAEATKTRPAKAGFKRIMFEITEDMHNQLEQWCKDEDRTGGASEAARVLFKRHFSYLISNGAFSDPQPPANG